MENWLIPGFAAFFGLLLLAFLLLRGKNEPSALSIVVLSAGAKIQIALDNITVNSEVFDREGLLFLRWSACIYQASGSAKEIAITTFCLADKIGGDEFLVSIIMDNDLVYELYGVIIADEQYASLSLGLNPKKEETAPVLAPA